MNNKISIKQNQKGQTLIFILVTMVVALAAGVSLSTRAISSVRRTTNLDTSARALAIAEAGLEYYLSLSGEQLNIMAGDTTGSECTNNISTYLYPDTNGVLGGDGVKSWAKINVNKTGCLEALDSSELIFLKEGEVYEHKLEGFNYEYEICWRTIPASGNTKSSHLYLQEIYDDAGTIKVRKTGYWAHNSYSNNFIQITRVKNQVYRCIEYNGATNAKFIRILSLYNDSEIFLINAEAGAPSMPYQGWKITSTGVIGQDLASDTNIERKVSATKSRPYLPAIFNFGIYSGSTIGTP